MINLLNRKTSTCRKNQTSFAGICLIKSHRKQRTEQLNKIKIYVL